MSAASGEPRPRILIVEDRDDLRTVTSNLLRNNGFEVLEARDGAEAVSVFGEKASCILLVVLDFMLPDMSGLEVFSRLQELDPNVRVILWSGDRIKPVVAAMVSAGVLDFVPKGVGFDTLLGSIKKRLETQEPGQGHGVGLGQG